MCSSDLLCDIPVLEQNILDRATDWAPVFLMCKVVSLQGEWRQKQVDNPDYKGAWVHPEIDNPEYSDDDTIYKFDSIGVLGLDLWQVCTPSGLEQGGGGTTMS